MDKLKRAAQGIKPRHIITALAAVGGAAGAVLLHWAIISYTGAGGFLALLAAVAVLAAGIFAGIKFSAAAEGLIERLLNREILMYLVFGGLTTLIDFVVFYTAYNYIRIDETAATAAAWLFAVVFAYVTNRKWVFESRENSAKGIAREAGKFFAARLLSLGLSELIVLIMMKLLGFDGKLGSIVTKLVCSVVVVIFNYVAGKFVVFKEQ